MLVTIDKRGSINLPVTVRLTEEGLAKLQAARASGSGVLPEWMAPAASKMVAAEASFGALPYI